MYLKLNNTCWQQPSPCVTDVVYKDKIAPEPVPADCGEGWGFSQHLYMSTIVQSMPGHMELLSNTTHYSLVKLFLLPFADMVEINP